MIRAPQSRLFVPFMMVFVLLFAGCHKPVVQSTRREVNASVSEPNTIGYYLPKGMVHITFKPEDNEPTLSIETVIIPDPEQFYTMNYCASAFSDDVVEVEFDNHTDRTKPPIFIKKINTQVTDRWVNIINKLAEIAKESAKLGVAGFPGAKVAMPQVKYTQYLDVVLDPDDAQALQQVNDFIVPYGIAIKVEPLGFEKSAVTTGPLEQKGIYTRMSLPYKVSVISKLSPAEFTETVTTEAKEIEGIKTVKIQGAIMTKILILPNGGPILAPDITRALFVKKDTELNFKDGRLTAYKFNKPSEALGFVMIPYNLAQDIISIPSELFKLRIALPTKKGELLQEKAAELYYRNQILQEQSEAPKSLNIAPTRPPQPTKP